MDIYENTSDKISQGDILVVDDNILYERFSIDSGEIPNVTGLIIMSNSCDIQQNNINFITFAPIIILKYQISSIKKAKESTNTKSDNIKKAVEQYIRDLTVYNNARFFFLPKNKERGILEDSIVMLEVPLIALRSNIEDLFDSRICTIKSPWKEKFGWRVGNMYNRVSLENYPKDLINKMNKEFTKNM